MKVTCIVGSAREEGSCNYLIDTLVRGVNYSDRNAEIIKYSVAATEINFCRGCKKCYQSGYCFQNDDVLKIVNDVITSDFVVIASPSYWADVPAQLKAFFDRCTPFGDTNPERKLIADKKIKGIAIAVRAGVRQAENDLILNSIEHYFGHMGITPIKRLSVLQTDSLEDLLTKQQNKINDAYEIGKSMAI